MQNIIDLIVVDAFGMNEVLFKFHADKPLGLLMVTYCQRNNLDMNSITFRVNRTEEYMTPNETPLSMNLNNKEVITAL